MDLVRPTVALKIYERPSITVQGNVEFGTGGTVYAAIQHPSEPYVFQVVNSGITVLDISDRSAPVVVGTVTAAVGLIGNQAIQGLCFDESGRYLYATSGTTSLYTFDLGAAFAAIEDPPLDDTLAISQGNGLHVLLEGAPSSAVFFILADTVTNNSLQVIDISTLDNPSVLSTTAMTGHDLEAQLGFWNTGKTIIAYPAGDTSGKILLMLGANPASNTTIQLPTFGGNQVRCNGIVFSDDDAALAILAFYTANNIIHYFWMVYDFSGSLSADIVCTTETISAAGAISTSLSAPIIASTPRHAYFQGAYWKDAIAEQNLAVTIRDDSFGNVAQLRFYHWSGLRVPRPAAAVDIPNTYSVRPLNTVASPQEWYCMGPSADRTNGVLALLESSLWSLDGSISTFDLYPYVLDESAIDVSHGIAGTDPQDRLARTGTMSFALDNSQYNDSSDLGGFSPDTTTPISALFVVGAPISLTLDAGDFIWYGVIESITPTTGQYKERRVRVTCVDGMDVLATTYVDLAPLKSNISTKEALLTLWDRVPYSPGTENFEIATATGEIEDSIIHEYAFDRAYNQRTKVVGEMQKIVNASTGFLFYDPQHVGLHFLSLEAYKNQPLNEPAFLDAMLEMTLTHSASAIYNRVSVRYYPRLLDSGATTVLFTLSSPMLIRAGETVTISAAYRDPDGLASRVGGIDMVTPVEGTDYRLRTRKDGGGTVLDSQLSVSAEFGGSGAEVVLTNAGPLQGYPSLLQLRGRGVYTQEPVTVTVEDVDSITQYCVREYTLDAQYLTTEEQAQALADSILSVRAQPHTIIEKMSFTPNRSAALMTLFLSLKPTKKLPIQETLSGLTAPDYWALGDAGRSELDDTTELYGLDVYSIQRMSYKISNSRVIEADLEMIPEDLSFRAPAWIQPKTWTDDELPTPSQFNLLIRDNVNAIWHVKAVQSADVVKTTSTTFSDLTGLTFNVLAGETWQFFVVSFIDSNSTAHSKYTVVARDANSNAVNSSVFGRFGIWGIAQPGAAGHSSAYSGEVDALTSGTNEDSMFLTGRISSPLDVTVQVQGAQRVSSGTTTFRQNSFLMAFRIGRPT